MEFLFEVDKDVRAETQKEVQAILNDIAVKLSNELKTEAPVDTGQLRQSITIVERNQGSIVVGVQAKYALALQEGTDAFTPPLQPLKEWGRRKLGSEQAGAAVWQKIRDEGIDANPFVTRAIENLRSEYS